ncbi:helix-turn-helix transcriptional regulator [Streptomyces harbinensis]|uniref:helix-turn-helix domain-containing protein n=1 Tax=Streptomyces harbinensis TaxID=1176198 RepID=UPI00339A8813
MELTSRNSQVPDARLGRRIRALRKARGLSLRALSAEVHGFAFSYIGRVELGKQPASAALVAALDDFFQAGGALVELHDVERDIEIARYSREYVRKEREARRIQVFTSSVIPGLLQTAEYAEELFRVGLPAESQEGLAAKVAVRIGRQALLDGDDPPYYWAVLDESALKRPVMGEGAMRRQLEALLVAGERRRIEIQVLPWTQGLHPMLGGSLTLLTLSSGETWAHLESFDSGQSVSSAEDATYVIEQQTRFDGARAMALSARDSADLIRTYLEEST